jgi:hypothetical protein
MLKRMRRITPSILLPIAEERGGRVNMVPTGGDLHIWPELESELQRKANGYEQLARLCRLRKIPSRATFRKFAFVWPVQYINSCTGHPHYAAASRLLSYAGIDKNEKQLKVAFHSALEHYPSVLSWMGRATSFLHETAGFI